MASFPLDTYDGSGTFSQTETGSSGEDLHEESSYDFLADGTRSGTTSTTRETTVTWLRQRQDVVSFTGSDAVTKTVTIDTQDSGEQTGELVDETTETAGAISTQSGGTFQGSQTLTISQDDGQSVYQEEISVDVTDVVGADGTVVRTGSPVRTVTGAQTLDHAIALFIASLESTEAFEPTNQSNSSESPAPGLDEWDAALDSLGEGGGVGFWSESDGPPLALMGVQGGPPPTGIAGLIEEFEEQFWSVYNSLASLTPEERDAALDILGLALDIGGIFDPTPTTDGLGGMLNLSRWDLWGVATSVVSMVPLFGDTAKLGRIGSYIEKAKKAIGLAKANPRCFKLMEPIFKALHKVLDAAPLNHLSDRVSAPLTKLRDDVKELLITKCFAAGTPILTPDGERPIESLRPGDWVLSAPEDDPDAPPVPRRVEKVFEGISPILHLRVGGVVIRTTSGHPFWVDGRGWVPVEDLAEGDRLRSHDGSTALVSGVVDLQETTPVYNMRIAEYHTYFVGSAAWGFSVWAHNTCDGAKPPNGRGVDVRAPRPGRMHVEDYRLSTGETGRDFIIPGRSVDEVFAGRLKDGTKTLDVIWTESLGLGTLVNRIAKAEELAGGPGSFNRITAYASENLQKLIQAGRFNTQEFAQSLNRRLGGQWSVELTPKPNSSTWDIIAIRIGD